MVRTSERTGFQTCRWQWKQGWVNKLKPIQEAPALRFGTLIHKALEVRYPPGIKRGPKPAATFEKLFKKEQAEQEKATKMKVDEKWEDMLEVGISMMEMFIEKYGKDEEWKVLGSEMTYKVPVYSPPHLDGDGFINLKGERIPKRVILFYQVGTMDGVWESRMDGGVRIIDWKTTSSDPVKEGSGKGALDEQATAYWTWGCDYLIGKKLLKPRQLQQLDGMLYTFLRKAKRDERDQDSEGYYLNKPKKDGTRERSKQQPPPYFHRELVYRTEEERTRARIRAFQQVSEMVQAEEGLIPTYKTPATGSFGGHCNWCGFRDMCELHEAGSDWVSLRDATMTVWDPYSAHEIEEEGKAR
jgi:hypothetical protein